MYFVNQVEVFMWAILDVFKIHRDLALATNRGR
jgi:hypothetical protein